MTDDHHGHRPGSAFLIGVDVGGTFTDFFAYDAASGRSVRLKRPSTPADPGAAVADGLADLLSREGIAPEGVARFAHGTTVGTNALIMRRGAKTALVTTAGFEDLLEIGRQIRPKLYDLKADAPPPLVPRELRFGVKERVGPAGETIHPLDEDDLTAVVEKIAAADVAAVAVCFLFSFLAPDHERRIKKVLAERLPDVAVSISSEVRPEFREYERLSTTVLNAYLQPLVGRYIERLGARLAEIAPRAHLGVNQSSGGLMGFDATATFPVRTALSGPAAGAVGAAAAARAAGIPDVITLDMGGTSADVCLIEGGKPGIAFEREVAGLPVRLPMVDIDTVGAGGGSIAWFDADGLMKVGPISAGADPGPACYGLGGTEATVTDANLVLGRLSTRGLAGGSMALDLGRARAAIAPVAERLGRTVEEAARGIVSVVCANMVRSIRTVSVERGHDPRSFALMPFGGAGLLHAGEVARMLSMKTIVAPESPGLLCAQGLLVADLQEAFTAPVLALLDHDTWPRLDAALGHLVARAEAWMAAEDIAPADRRFAVALDMRYRGQNFELTVDAADSDGAIAPGLPDVAALKSAFHATHERYYGYAEDAPVEVTAVRLTGYGRLAAIPAPPEDPGPKPAPEPMERRPVWFLAGEAVDAPVYDRATLRPDQRIAGPAIIEQLDATTVLHPGDVATVHASRALVIEVGS